MRAFEKFRLPHVVFGEGAAVQAGEKLKSLGGTKCLVVTDQGVINTGLVDPIVNSLKEAGIEILNSGSGGRFFIRSGQHDCRLHTHFPVV